jgi:hypothetical protein
VKAPIEFYGKLTTPVLLPETYTAVAKDIKNINGIRRRFRTTHPIHEISDVELCSVCGYLL